MSFLFWSMTLGLLFLACGWMLPWLSKTRHGIIIFSVLSLATYSIYFSLGSSQHLSAYYSVNQAQRAKMQPLMVELKKQEYRLRFHLEEYPGDNLAHSQLLEVLAIQALQSGDKKLAKRCLKEAVDQISKTELENRKVHLHAILKNID